MEFDRNLVLGCCFAVITIISFIFMIKEKTKLVDDIFALNLKITIVFLIFLILTIVSFYKYFNQ
jgi:hypothetical protein